jgi:23S rRNA (cytidine1920-2'-O)/16S rRNA (cytidine1409-2'-O)-methyltransferase
MARPPNKKERLDQGLVRLSLVESLDEARALILAGAVIVNEQRIDKPGTMILLSDKVRLKQKSRFVSRGGDKLLGAIEALGLKTQFNDKIILDIGSSTGGFTDCVLQLGAKKVYAIDVGTNQLAWSLRKDPRVISKEETHIKDFVRPPHEAFDWIVADVSFNSISNLADEIARLSSRSSLLILVKPQFELEAGQIPRGGIVTDDTDRRKAVDKAIGALASHGWKIVSTLNSPLKGASGNQEIFLYATWDQEQSE